MVDQWTANSCPWRVEDVSLNGVEWVSRCWSQLYLGRRNFKMSHFLNAIRTIDWRTTWKYPRPMSWISGPWVHWEVCILRCQVGKVSSGEAQLFTLCPGTEKGVFFRENQTFRDTCRWLDMGKQASTCMLIDFGCIPKSNINFTVVSGIAYLISRLSPLWPSKVLAVSFPDFSEIQSGLCRSLAVSWTLPSLGRALGDWELMFQSVSKHVLKCLTDSWKLL